MTKIERIIYNRGRLLDEYVTEHGGLVKLFKLPGTYATQFPDGSVEYHSSDVNWKSDISWRYGDQRQTA